MEWSRRESDRRFWKVLMMSCNFTSAQYGRDHIAGASGGRSQFIITASGTATERSYTYETKTAIDQTAHLMTATQRDQYMKTICFISVHHLHDIHRPSRTVNDLDGLPGPYFYIPDIYPSYYPLQEYLESYFHLLVEHFVGR